MTRRTFCEQCTYDAKLVPGKCIFAVFKCRTLVLYVLFMVPKFLDKKSTHEGTLFEYAPISIYQLDPLVFLRILENSVLGTNGPMYSRQSALVPEIHPVK